MNLADLKDRELADEVRRLEQLYRDGLAELTKRQDVTTLGEWSEAFVAACLARRKIDPQWHPTTNEQVKTETLPPPLFRMGYEWAALSIMSVLESVLDRPSDDVTEVWDFVPAGRDLFRRSQRSKVYDARRRGAFELIQLFERFVNNRMAAFYVPHPVKIASAFVPGDNDAPALNRPD